MISSEEIKRLEKETFIMAGDQASSSEIIPTPATLESQLNELSKHKLGLTTYTAFSNAVVFLGFIIGHSVRINVGILVVSCIFIIFGVAFLLARPLLQLTNKFMKLLPISRLS